MDEYARKITVWDLLLYPLCNGAFVVLVVYLSTILGDVEDWSFKENMWLIGVLLKIFKIVTLIMSIAVVLGLVVEWCKLAKNYILGVQMIIKNEYIKAVSILIICYAILSLIETFSPEKILMTIPISFIFAGVVYQFRKGYKQGQESESRRQKESEIYFDAIRKLDETLKSIVPYELEDFFYKALIEKKIGEAIKVQVNEILALIKVDFSQLSSDQVSGLRARADTYLRKVFSENCDEYAKYFWNRGYGQDAMCEHEMTLEITKPYTRSDLRKAYHRLAKKFHPDRADATEKALAEERMKKINASYRTLMDRAV